MVSHFYGFLLNLLDTFGAMPKRGNQDLRRTETSLQLSGLLPWGLGFESLVGIQVFIRRMQRGGNPCFNREQMSSNKMPLGLSVVFGCVLVE